MEKLNLSIGQIVFAEPRANAARNSKEIIECEVLTVGRKNFTLKKKNGINFRNKFSLETRQEVSQYMSDYVIYTSLKEIEDKNRKPIIIKDITDKLHTLSVDELESLFKILK